MLEVPVRRIDDQFPGGLLLPAVAGFPGALARPEPRVGDSVAVDCIWESRVARSASKASISGLLVAVGVIPSVLVRSCSRALLRDCSARSVLSLFSIWNKAAVFSSSISLLLVD